MEKIRVLVVDDEVPITNIIEKMLKRYGYAVAAVNDPQQGIDMALAEKFDLLLIDWKMPEIDGLEVIDKVREKGVSSKIVVMTAQPSDQIMIELRNRKISGYLVKPFEVSELVSVVENTIVEN